MTPPAVRPLPGFAFVSAAPVNDEVLPRMDVAVFAGFAARGPVNVPVPVEDAAQFAAIFGEDAPLALDVERGVTSTAQLAPAVRLFFTNGGKRCWVIRLARNARANLFPVRGVVAMSGGRLVPLSLPARSPGSWSDGLALSATLTARRYGIRSWNRASGQLELVGPADAPLVEGSLLRIGARGAGAVLYAAVATVSSRGDALLSGRRALFSVTLGEQRWFDPMRTPSRVAGETRVHGELVPAEFVSARADAGAFTSEVRLALATEAARAPRPGDVLVVHFDDETLLLTVHRVDVAPVLASPVAESVGVTGKGVWMRAAGPVALPSLNALSVESLAVDLWSRAGAGAVRHLDGLGLAPGHPRHVELIPDDAAVYQDRPRLEDDAWRDASSFPVAGSGAPRLCIPFGVDALPGEFLPASIPEGVALERDGLVPFDAALFGDPVLAGSGTSTLLEDAEYLRTLGTLPRQLIGLHRALDVEEATLFAVPDAVHTGWVAMDADAPPPPDPSEAGEGDPRDEPPFMDCGVVPGRGPWLEVAGEGAGGSVTLEWTAAAETREFQLQESTSRDWSGAIEVFSGAGNMATIGSRRPGDYYYRVRGIGEHPTHWSNGVGVRVSGGRGWRVRRAGEYRDDALLAVHRMMLRCCAARRDIMSVLALPAHYRDDDAAAHARRLAAGDVPGTPVPFRTVAPLGFGEREALGFGALYHGWLATRDDDGVVRAVAPDGVACGLIARRTLERGAWVAPANEALRGVVALARPMDSAQEGTLLQLSVNPIVRAPRGFTVMSADTLAPDDEVRPINVRRLLILLRREATRRGATYVFEPNDDSFRRMVQRGFEAMLATLFERGAFAGDTAATAFQVRTDSSLNTPASLDQGRLIVEIRVAPSRPLEFLTVRLVQTGDRVTLTGA